MKKTIQRAFLFVISVVVVLSAGCQKELAGEKKGRIIAAENIQLKKDLNQRDQKIEILTKEHEKEVKLLKEQLSKCLEQKEALEKQLQQKVKEQVDKVLAMVMEENAKLREEIKDLKAQIEKLKQERCYFF